MKKTLLILAVSFLVACQKDEDVLPAMLPESPQQEDSVITELDEIPDSLYALAEDTMFVSVSAVGSLEPWHYIGNFVNSDFYGNGPAIYVVQHGDTLLTRTRHQYPDQVPLVPVCTQVVLYQYVAPDPAVVVWDTIFCSSTPTTINIFKIVP